MANFVTVEEANKALDEIRAGLKRYKAAVLAECLKPEKRGDGTVGGRTCFEIHAAIEELKLRDV